MQVADKIRHAVQQVSLLRQACTANPELGDAVMQIKRLQSQRFAGTYADLLSGGSYQHAARFFLDELYSDRDYTQRDEQFARIAGALERLFPDQVAATAMELAGLHALTEELDQAMALAWLGQVDEASGAARYIAAWREVARRADRQQQLRCVLSLGQDLARLTRTRGLRTMLRMMRGPASAAGLGALQQFLEAGFDTFAGMARDRDGVAGFLGTIEQRESRLIDDLFNLPPVACETTLARTLGQAR